MGQFKPMQKMETTEPSAILKLKKGGVAKKAIGGALPSAAPVMGAAPEMAARMAAAKPRGAALMASRAPVRPAPGMPAQAMGRKKGGEVESKAMHAKEEREIKGIKKELKSHEGKPAGKAHKGLKTGGVISKEGSKTGTVEQFRGGYKKGGKACMAGGGGVPAGVGMSLTPATRAMAEKARPMTPPTTTSRDMSKPTPAEMAAMRQQLADQKMDSATDAGYNRTYSKKTGGVIKKFAAGGCVEGFKANKKGGTW